MEFGERLRELRTQQALTLRTLAETIGVDFSYLSKIENGRAGYLPGAEKIRALAEALGVDALELLELAGKVPPEVETLASSPQARRFFRRAQEIASPEDWDALLSVLEKRQKKRSEGDDGGKPS